ncbi:hypothetical protein Btru_051779 [Bulinus truncatus]|nr:hypothetical protein Btru_051779 [Bulinus truncatus]
MQPSRLIRCIHFQLIRYRLYSSKVPEIDLKLIEQLERLSLVEFNNKEGFISLQKSVQSADLLQSVDTSNVEPLATVFEDRSVFLREDKVTEGNNLKEILSNASKVEENYFVAPPGNIPMKKRDKEYLKTVVPDQPTQ